MATNFLEQLVAEWFEYQGYFVRRNIPVERRLNGGYDSELDIVAFNPIERHLVHIEPSMDSHSWAKREQRFKKKFDLGRKHIPALFQNLDIPKEPEQIALLVYASNKQRETLGGGKILLIGDFMATIKTGLAGKRVDNQAVPEQFVILRSLQFALNYWPKI